MDKYFRVSSGQLKVGDIFAFLGIETKQPQKARFVVTKVYDDPNYIAFRNTKDPMQSWSKYHVYPGLWERIVKYSSGMSKDEAILEKIKYLDKRFEERRAHVA